MKKKLKATETAATNTDFYNLFRPIAPSIDIIGKVAQVISGLTEAITIWYITQSEMAGTSKALSIAVSIVAMLLVIAVLELGGRKFLQVLTRAIVWKRLKNAWYVALFAIVAAITAGMGILSFNLSTNGIQHAFVSNVPVHRTFDASALKQEYRQELAQLNQQFDKELQLLRDNQASVLSGKTAQFDARIKNESLKVASYDRKFANGEKWAHSHAEKHRKTVANLETEKAAAMAALQTGFTEKLDNWQLRKNEASANLQSELKASIGKGERAMSSRQDTQFKTATFWGKLFSFFVGFSVVLAFICIITTEVYRRGCGIQVEYQEEDKEASLLELFWNGLTGRFDRFFRKRVERFAQISKGAPAATPIGFNYRSALPSNSGPADLPQARVED
ncbi:MAG: hypothetical protein AAGG75_12230 [Bacteroidota bacterium]